MDRSDLDSEKARSIINELNSLVKELQAKNLSISSWYGNFKLSGKKDSAEWVNRGYDYKRLDSSEDDNDFPWFLYWEIVWLVINNNFMSGQSVLDLGGSSSLFSYYLARKGLSVTTVDLQKKLVDNADYVADKMGWQMRNFVMDMNDIRFNKKFDHIVSVCVFEHIPMFQRIEINKKIKKLLSPKGKFSITFDYRNPLKNANICSPHDVYKQFIEPSGLAVRGNNEFYDNAKNYLLQPFYYNHYLWKYKKYVIKNNLINFWEFFRTKNSNDYTFGALFLEQNE